LGAVEEATAEAAKHGGRSEQLTALVEEAREMIEQARAAKAERARVATEEAEAAAAVAVATEAAERLRLEDEVAALALVMESAALRMQQVQAQLGSSVVPSAAPAPRLGAEETMCVVCMDAPKDRVVLPCGHMCVCAACAQLLRDLCPVCRGPIERLVQVFT
jgi:hypothetical protein